MKTQNALVGIVVSLLIGACAGQAERRLIVPDGKSDSFGFQFGTFSNDSYGEGATPLFIAFHDVSEGLPEGYVGHFDYAVFDPEAYDEALTYYSGIFQLYAEEDVVGILLLGYDGHPIDEFEWSYDGAVFVLGDHRFNRLRQSSREEVIRDCEAFQVVDLSRFEESFTPWEYPSVQVETAPEGGYEVSLGASGFATKDGDTIEVGSNAAGEFEAKVLTANGNTVVVQISNDGPARGRVLYANGAEEPQLLANLVCYRTATEPAAAKVDLDPTDPLRIVVERTAQRWADENISSSGLGIETAALTERAALDSAAMQAFTDGLLRSMFEGVESAALPEVAIQTTEVEDDVDTAVEIVSDRVSDEGFGYSPENAKGRWGVFWAVSQLIDWLDVDREYSVVYEATTTVSSEEGLQQNVAVTLFLNPQTRKYVAIYVRQGEF